MNTCKAAFLIIRAHMAVILGYLVACSLLMVILAIGVVVALGNENGDTADTFQSTTVGMAVIDRDDASNHAFKRGLERALGENATFLDVRDAKRDMQDAVATDQAKLLVVIPQGYAERFAQAARNGGAMPTVETVTSFSSGSASMASIQVNGFLSTVRAALSVDGNISINEAINRVIEQKSHLPKVAVQAMSVDSDGDNASKRSSAVSVSAFIVVSGSMIYSMLAVMTLAVGLVVSRFNEGLVRERLGAAPQSAAGVGGGVLAASLIMAMVVWIYHVALVLIVAAVMPGGLSALRPDSVGLSLIAIAALSLMTLAFGFMVGQFGLSPNATSGVSNVMSLSMTFLSSAWIPSSLMPDAMVTVAKFTPGWWYVEAIYQAFGGRDAAIAGAPDFNGWYESVGIVLLFALAFASVGLAFSRLRQLNPTGSGAMLTQVM
ncbi:ABC transporter permease [Bifidobacterium oedipodis]|uniref:ABC-2 family transporter protein n=1 Tax=Bifidobacterium oedipodis TaxID=2675322 RepID=A0A7Y0EN00_9BIFI|nr:ABC transporter permease [Bifidobacterium sp. DSM 109957]NMM93207.1 ABC-2 family transporter protein [Bifidobacterium sp. DSM 109957]